MLWCCLFHCRCFSVSALEKPLLVWSRCPSVLTHLVRGFSRARCRSTWNGRHWIMRPRSWLLRDDLESPSFFFPWKKVDYLQVEGSWGLTSHPLSYELKVPAHWNVIIFSPIPLYQASSFPAGLTSICRMSLHQAEEPDSCLLPSQQFENSHACPDSSVLETVWFIIPERIQ